MSLKPKVALSQDFLLNLASHANWMNQESAAITVAASRGMDATIWTFTRNGQ